MTLPNCSSHRQFGDCWEFYIIVDVKSEPGLILKEPEIIKSVGKSPEQYPDYDEEDDDDEDGEE